MALRPTIYSSISRPIGSTVLGGGFSGLLDQYPGAAAAYSLRALSSNWISGDVVEVRRSSDNASQGFTDSQITGDVLLDFVNHDTTSLYNDKMYFDGVDDSIMLPSQIDYGTSAFSLSIETFIENVNGVQILGGGLTATRWILRIINANTWDLREGNTAIARSATFDSPLIANSYVKFTLTRVGDVVTMSVNDVEQVDTVTVTSGANGNLGWFSIGSDGSGAGNLHTGVVLSISDSLGTSWDGTNADATNQGWTVNGSPEVYTGQPFDGFVSTWYDQSGATVRDATQATTTEQIKIVDAGALVVDGNGNTSTLWDGIDDDLDVIVGFAGLTAANVYAATDNNGVLTLTTLTAQDISTATNLSSILASLTYDKVTALVIYSDATDQSGIEDFINDLYGI